MDDWIRFFARLEQLKEEGCLIEAEPYAEVSVLQKPYNWEEEDIHDQNAL